VRDAGPGRAQGARRDEDVDPVRVLRQLRDAGAPLAEHARAYALLFGLELREEATRLQRVVFAGLLMGASLACLLLTLGLLSIAASWDTQWRVPVAVAVIVVYGLAAAFASRRQSTLVAQAPRAFAATRAELAADVASWRSLH
jgi:uncharacterized membrane protein YqjE